MVIIDDINGCIKSTELPGFKVNIDGTVISIQVALDYFLKSADGRIKDMSEDEYSKMFNYLLDMAKIKA